MNAAVLETFSEFLHYFTPKMEEESSSKLL